MFMIDERKADFKTGGKQNEIHFFAAAVYKPHTPLLKSLNVGSHCQVAVAQMIVQLRVDDWMAFEESVIGPGQTGRLAFASPSAPTVMAMPGPSDLMSSPEKPKFSRATLSLAAAKSLPSNA